jgi:sugar lactone lactonase YvrE
MRSAIFIKATTAALALAGLVGYLAAQSKSTPKVPTFKYDGAWPKLPLPNQWTFEGITGLTVDKDDIVWVLERPGDFDEDPITHRKEVTENFASLNPPTALCCKKPPAVLGFDQAGNLVQHWDVENQNGLHLILADKAGNIWVGTDTMRKFSKDGKLLATVPRVPEKVGAIKAGQYPGDTPMVIGGIEGGQFLESDRELFVTDNYLRGRILVFDMDTLRFKRGWGAYGKPLKDIAVTQNFKYSSSVEPPKDFVNHLTVSVSDDGMVYAADRGADRIQVFTKDGKFVREFTVAPETLDRGSTGGLTFSRPVPTFIYISDIMNNVVWIVNRADGQTLGHFGFFSHAGGGFHYLHMVATDSKGNVYTGEVDTGKRVQRFLVQR